jgi:uncharacterized protein (TIGR03435 family)
MICGLVVHALAQTGPSFEVASIKPNKSGTTVANASLQPNGVNLLNLPLRGIIQLAYGINQPSKLVGAPDWLAGERYDIVARASGTVTGDEVRLMLQNLLTDRFKLIASRETRSQDVYVLALARKEGTLGDHLRASTSSCAPPVAASGGGTAGQPQTTASPTPPCGPRPGGSGRLILEGSPMSLFTSLLALVVGRTIIDETGLTGRYDIDLSFAPERQLLGGPADGAIDPNAPSLFTAVQEQLGLKLESVRRSDEVLVIERVERPTEN